MAMNHKKYKSYPRFEFKERTWPNNITTKAPIWCSVDLRDGNQALPIPMGIEEKLLLYKMLIKIGFKTIEVGFPSASETEFKFLRKLVEDKLIPEDVTIQVLTQAREHLIARTFESLKGVKNAIVHIYNSTSELQRRVVFNKNKEEIKKIATEGTSLVKKFAAEAKHEGLNVILQYSPESFTGTELDYAVEVSNAVLDIWEPSKENKAVINLPSTVEMSTPNIYADQIEWFCKNVNYREFIEISLHAHNDRGTGIAATELGLLAGADRVEGTLFGNGERTGNTDILTVALNLYSQGIDPELDFYDVEEIKEVFEKVTQLPVHPRHPYVGDLVHTAFSGSHQDAINKGLKYRAEKSVDIWEVPYLPIDPSDVGRKYEAVIRINSQSGKGGIAFVLETEYGFKLPKIMHPELAKLIQKETDNTGAELKKEDILKIFEDNYINVNGLLELVKYKVNEDTSEEDLESVVTLEGLVKVNGENINISGKGNGPVSAFINAIELCNIGKFTVTSYDEHAREEGDKSQAITYVQIENLDTKARFFGVGISPNITSASIKAIVSAINRSK